MLDVDGEPCTAQTFLTRVHPEDRGALEQAIAHAIQTHTEYQQEFRAVWRDGQVRWLEGRGRVYYAADGRALRMIGVATDITARKHAQEEAWRLQEQAALAASALEADRLKTALLNTVSHELRTPLGVIKGFASTLLAFPGRLDAAEQRAFLQEIESAADRLTDLVNDLLEVSRMESGTVPMQQEPLRLGDLLRRATADASRRYPERHITLDTSCNPGIRGDPHRLVQVAVNLIDNAVKFSPDGGEVAVSAWCAQGIAGFSVRDRGIGIAPEYHGRIFDRFYRVDTPRAREIGGAGLGLALCREIIERHGGTITVESAAGAGTTVTVRLPTRTEPLEAEAAG
jgi:signal transduction histidine kinase